MADKMRSKIFEYNGLMIEAHFHFEEGNEASGLASLRRALAIGKNRGFLNTFVDEPAVTAKLCIKALEENIEVPYVQEIIRRRRLILEEPPLHLENWPWPLKIFTLGRFEILRDGKPLQFSRKIQEKPLSMLKALIALGGKEVKKDDLADLLWPEADGDYAHHSFEMTLHRLRTLLGHPEALLFRERCLILNQDYCWVDAWGFERTLEEVGGRRTEGMTETAAMKLQKAIEMYRGSFLAGETGKPWAISLAEGLRRKFLRGVITLGHFWDENGKYEKALDCYERGLEVDNLAEELYKRLMVCYQRLGRKAEALSVYNRCKKTLATVLGIEPSPQTRSLYHSIKETAKNSKSVLF